MVTTQLNPAQINVLGLMSYINTEQEQQGMKIVLDTNCLVNIIMPSSYNNDVWQGFRALQSLRNTIFPRWMCARLMNS